MKPVFNLKCAALLSRNLPISCKFPNTFLQRYASSYKSKQPPSAKEMDEIPSDETIINRIMNRKTLPLTVRLRTVLKKPNGIYDYFKSKRIETEKEEQFYDNERHSKLGPDLSAAHFVLFRGGSVKFQNLDKWISLSKNQSSVDVIPSQFDLNYVLTGIDISSLPVRIESLTNFTSLTNLTHLSIAKCELADDWWLDYISGELNSLKYLNLTNCSNITFRGLSILYRLQKLESLVIKGIPYSPFLEMTCLQLEELLPNLQISGSEDWEVYKDVKTSNSVAVSSSDT